MCFFSDEGPFSGVEQCWSPPRSTLDRGMGRMNVSHNPILRLWTILLHYSNWIWIAMTASFMGTFRIRQSIGLYWTCNEGWRDSWVGIWFQQLGRQHSLHNVLQSTWNAVNSNWINTWAITDIKTLLVILFDNTSWNVGFGNKWSMLIYRRVMMRKKYASWSAPRPADDQNQFWKWMNECTGISIMGCNLEMFQRIHACLLLVLQNIFSRIARRKLCIVSWKWILVAGRVVSAVIGGACKDL